MKAVLVTILISLVIVTNLFSQKSSFPMGAYYSLDEIRKKQPGFKSNFKIENRPSSEIKNWGGNDFKPVSINNSMGEETIKNYIFAISNGDTLFLNGSLLNGQPWYSNVISEGKYLAFKAAVPRGQNDFTLQAGVMFGLIGATHAYFHNNALAAGIKFLFVLDISSGEVFLLDKKRLETILTDYPNLKDKYELEPDNWSKEILIKYISLINLPQ